MEIRYVMLSSYRIVSYQFYGRRIGLYVHIFMRYLMFTYFFVNVKTSYTGSR